MHCQGQQQQRSTALTHQQLQHHNDSYPPHSLPHSHPAHSSRPYAKSSSPEQGEATSGVTPQTSACSFSPDRAVTAMAMATATFAPPSVYSSAIEPPPTTVTSSFSLLPRVQRPKRRHDDAVQQSPLVLA
jgi:hypothetical protein